MKPFTTLGAAIFALIALGHLYRVVRRLAVTVAGTDIPMWVSIVGMVVAAGLAVMLWREARGVPASGRHWPR